MSKYEDRVKTIEYNTGKKLTDEEKLSVAFDFDVQDYRKAIELMENGTNPQCIIEEGKKLGGWRMSMLQCDILKEADKYINR